MNDVFNVYEEDCQAITANLMIKVYAISKQAKAYKNGILSTHGLRVAPRSRDPGLRIV